MSITKEWMAPGNWSGSCVFGDYFWYFLFPHYKQVTIPMCWPNQILLKCSISSHIMLISSLRLDYLHLQ